MKELKAKRDAALEAHDHAGLKTMRRQLHELRLTIAQSRREDRFLILIPDSRFLIRDFGFPGVGNQESVVSPFRLRASVSFRIGGVISAVTMIMMTTAEKVASSTTFKFADTGKDQADFSSRDHAHADA
jgi:hypothetical protein